MKKLSFLFLLVLMCFGLVGCVVAENNPKTKEDEPKETNPTEGDEYDFATPFNKVVNLIAKDGVKDNINLPTSVGEVVFVWSSSDETVCTSRGVITRGLEDKEVTLTALMMVNGGKQATMSFTIKVLKTDAKIDKISDVLNADLTQSVLPSFSVLGTVIGVSSSSFLIQDETGMILVYRGYTWEHELVVGDTVLVAGTPTTYSGTVQFDGNATYTKTGTDSSFVQPNPKAVSGADLNKYVETLEHDYVKFTGTLSISGNYYNVAVEGANVTGSIVGPLVSDIDQMNGKEVTVTGYVLYLTGSGRFLNVLATSVEGDTTPIETTTKTIGEILEGPLGAYETEATVVAFNAQSFLISDGTGFLLVYRGRNWSQDVKVGQKVTLNGTVSVYNDVKQFEASATYELGEEGEYNAPNPKELTAAECDAFKEKCVVTYVKVTGKLAISGNYVNFTIPGATISGSVAYPIEDLSGLDGKWVEVTGYVLYTQSQGKYLSILATSVVETEEPSVPTPGPTEGATIAQVLAGELGDYETSGTVAAFNAQGFLLEDQGSFIFVYRGRDFAKDVAVGDKVKISGAVTVYNNVKQFGTDATYEKTASGSYNQPNARTLTASQCDAYKDNCKVEYVSVIGQLALSGNYVNFTIPGATITGSVAYSIEDLSVFDGKWVKVTGYVLYTTSQGKYLNIMATSVVETEEPTVPTPGPTEGATIAQVLAGELGDYETSGTVVAINTQSFLLGDSGSYILVYRGKEFAQDVAIGDKVKVSGAVTVYNNVKQFGTDATYEKTASGSYNQPTPRALTGADCDSLASNIKTEYVSVVGQLAISGNYVNFTIPGATITGSVAYSIEDLSGFDGKWVKVTGYVLYTTSQGKYLNIIATSVVEAEEPVITIPEVTVSDIVNGADGTYECVATVAAIYPQGFFVTDGTNYIIVYRGRSWQCDLVEGDEVQLTGAVELYNGGKEFKSDAQYVKTGKNNTVNLGQAKAALHDYFEEVADSEQVVAEYIEFDGLLNAASDKLYVKVSESLVNVVLLNAVDEYNSLDGKYVKVTGFAAYTDAAKKNLNVFALSCVETEGEYVEPTIEIPVDAIEGTDFDLEATFDKYGSLWSSSYELHEIKTYEMGYKEQYSIELSRANKQGQTITTMPVVAANDKNTPFETVTVTGDFSNFTKVTFSLVQWTTKTFSNIHIEYTTDGTTWIKCSEDITTPAALSTNVSIQGALKVRLVITAGKTSNVQIGIQKVTIE